MERLVPTPTTVNGAGGALTIAGAGGTSVAEAGGVVTVTSPALASAAPASVGSANAVGVGTTTARDNHVHQGVHSVSGAGVAKYGDVALAGAGGSAVSEAGQTLTVTSPALSDVAAAAVAAAGGAGVAATASRQDHTHAGVSSLSGGGAGLTGAVAVTGSGGAAITQGAGTVNVDADAAGAAAAAQAAAIAAAAATAVAKADYTQKNAILTGTGAGTYAAVTTAGAGDDGKVLEASNGAAGGWGLSDALIDAHAVRHNAGGLDAMAIDAVAGTGSLRTLGTGALQAAAGDHLHWQSYWLGPSGVSHTTGGAGSAWYVAPIGGFSWVTVGNGTLWYPTPVATVIDGLAVYTIGASGTKAGDSIRFSLFVNTVEVVASRVTISFGGTVYGQIVWAPATAIAQGDRVEVRVYATNVDAGARNWNQPAITLRLRPTGTP